MKNEVLVGPIRLDEPVETAGHVMVPAREWIEKQRLVFFVAGAL